MELLMKTYKEFNEQAQHHLHEVDRMNFGIPGSGLLMKGLGYLMKPAVYRTLGTIETGHQLYKDIKNKKMTEIKKTEYFFSLLKLINIF